MTVPTGTQVREARERAGLSRRQLAAHLTISEHQVLNVERGRRLTADEAVELVLAFRTHYQIEFDPSVEPVPAETPAATEAAVTRAQVDRAARSWSGSTQTSVALGPVRTGPIRQVSNSEVDTFLDCRRKWWLKWYRGLAQRHESPLGPLAIGDRVHRALQCFYVPDGTTPEHPGQALERLIAEDYSKLAEAGLVNPEVEKQFHVEANLERAMVAGYFEWIAETGEDDGLKVVAAEQYAEVEFMLPDEDGVEKPVVLISKMDVQVTLKSDGSRRFIDHKTMAEFARARARLKLGDPQMLFYHLVQFLSTEDGDARCSGALYNMLRKVKRTAAAKPPFFERLPITHNRTQVENFGQRLRGTVGDMMQAEDMLAAGVDHHLAAYPHPTNDCDWKCEFKHVCPMFDDGSRAEDMLAQLFVVRDPLSYYQGANQVAAAETP